MKFILKKDFQNCPKGSKVILTDVPTAHLYGSRKIRWYNVVDEFGTQIKLGNSETMNVDEWIEEVVPDNFHSVEYWEKKLRDRKDVLFKTAANIMDYPELYEAAKNLGASSILRDMREGWTTVGFMSVELKEEVKPREFQLGIGFNGDGVFAILLNDKNEGYNYDAKLPSVKEIIKVTEALK